MPPRPRPLEMVEIARPRLIWSTPEPRGRAAWTVWRAPLHLAALQKGGLAGMGPQDPGTG